MNEPTVIFEEDFNVWRRESNMDKATDEAMRRKNSILGWDGDDFTRVPDFDEHTDSIQVTWVGLLIDGCEYNYTWNVKVIRTPEDDD